MKRGVEKVVIEINICICTALLQSVKGRRSHSTVIGESFFLSKVYQQRGESCVMN